MTIKEWKAFIHGLPEEMLIVEKDTDGAHILFRKTQLKIEAGHLVLIPTKLYLRSKEKANTDIKRA